MAIPKQPKTVPPRARVRSKTRHPSQGPGQGAGWGGATAKGGNGKPKASASALIPGQPPHKLATSQAKRSIREARVEALEKVLFTIATAETERSETRVNAAAKLHAIYEGAPMQRQLNLTADDLGKLTDEELRAELARLGADDPGPSRAVH